MLIDGVFESVRIMRVRYWIIGVWHWTSQSTDWCTTVLGVDDGLLEEGRPILDVGGTNQLAYGLDGMKREGRREVCCLLPALS